MQSNQPNYTYTFIRLNLPIEQQIVQAAHSALEAGRELSKPDTISHLILLEAKSEEHLCSIAETLSAAGIKHHLFFEPDHSRGYTSLTTEALFTKEQRQHLAGYKLYRFNPKKAYSTKDESKLSTLI